MDKPSKSAERFQRRYGGQAPWGGPVESGFMGRHVFATLALALLAALTITVSLAIIFPKPEGESRVTFGPCGGDAECSAFEAAGYAPFTAHGFPCEEDEALTFAAPEAGTSPDGIACVHWELIEHNAIVSAVAFCKEQGGTLVGAFGLDETDHRTGEPICEKAQGRAFPQATPESTPTATAQPTATPCGPRTYRECGPAPVPQTNGTAIVALCADVSARMRGLVQAFDPNGEPPSRTLAGKLGRVNEPVCKARVTAPLSSLCVATQTAVNDVLARAQKEPEVLSQSQLATLRGVVELVCEAHGAQG